MGNEQKVSILRCFVFSSQTQAHWWDCIRVLELAGERKVPWRAARLGRNLKSRIFQAAQAWTPWESAGQCGPPRTLCPKSGPKTIELPDPKGPVGWDVGCVSADLRGTWLTCRRTSLTLPGNQALWGWAKGLGIGVLPASRDGYLELILSKFKEKEVYVFEKHYG